MRLLVVGTGLIGTSVALGARAAGHEVWLDDRDQDRVALAVSLGAGERWKHADRRGGGHGDGVDGVDGVDVAVVAVPPAAIGLVINELISSSVAPTVTHLASIQSDPQRQVERLHPGFEGFVGGHPIAGRERSGPHHASADLFARRPWIVCPTDHSSAAATAAVCDLAEACGAVVTVMSAARHDDLLARLSHVPQLVASALAGSLVGLDRADATLAGTGLRDTTRIADSQAAMWAEIVAANPTAVAAALRGVLAPLSAVLDAVDSPAEQDVAAAVTELISAGRRGRDLLGGKHGQQAIRYSTVAVVVPDEPGKLARLLVAAADAGVNVEDIRVDHSPGQPFGVVELDVAPELGESLEGHLAASGWSATASPPPPEG